MPSYRFHTTDAACGRHEHVCELPDIRTAKSIATALAADILREIHEQLYEEDLCIVVTDGDGQLCWDIRVTGIEGPGASDSA
jgi:hypothetical protein